MTEFPGALTTSRMTEAAERVDGGTLTPYSPALIRWDAAMTTHRPPVVFIHGLWLHATSWDALGRPVHRARATPPPRPAGPGTRTPSSRPARTRKPIADHGIDDVVDHYAALIAELPAKPILIGHSFGGMIAEKLLGQDLAAAAVAIDAAQIKGVLPLPLSSLRATLPVFKNPANKHRAVSLTAEQFRYGFGNAISEEESDELYERWTIPAPGKPLFEAAAANFSPHSPAEGRHRQRRAAGRCC